MKTAMKNQSGFTLIELIMVIVILGILAAVALPKFVDLSSQALTASKAGMGGTVKSTLAILQAQNAVAGSAVNPSVTALAAGMSPPGTAVATGVQFTINGVNYVAPTYANSACTTATTAATSTVACVGDVP